MKQALSGVAYCIPVNLGRITKTMNNLFYPFKRTGVAAIGYIYFALACVNADISNALNLPARMFDCKNTGCTGSSAQSKSCLLGIASFKISFHMTKILILSVQAKSFSLVFHCFGTRINRMERIQGEGAAAQRALKD